MTAEIYVDPYYRRSLDEMSRTGLEQFLRSPAHYWAWVHQHEEEPAGDGDHEIIQAKWFGKAFHCRMLQPDRWKAEWCIRPEFGDCRFKANKAARDTWKAANEGRKQLASKQGEVLEIMHEAVMSHPRLSKLLERAQCEHEIHWSDGVNLKSKLDAIDRERGIVLELKSVDDASPAAFKKAVFRYGYHRQEAFYRRAYRAETFEEPKHFVFAAVEKQAPRGEGVVLYLLDREWVAQADHQIDVALEQYQAIMAKEDWALPRAWPGYSRKVVQL